MVAALSALDAAFAESGYVARGVEFDLGLPPLLAAMAPFAARRLFWRSNVGIGSRGPGRSVLPPTPPLAAAKAWFAAEFPHLLDGIDARFSIRFAFSAARTAALLGPGAVWFGCQEAAILMSLARLAAFCAETLLASEAQSETDFVLAQPNEAAALAAASSFLRPREGYEGKSFGSAYLMRPPKCPIGENKAD